MNFGLSRRTECVRFTCTLELGSFPSLGKILFTPTSLICDDSRFLGSYIRERECRISRRCHYNSAHSKSCRLHSKYLRSLLGCQLYWCDSPNVSNITLRAYSLPDTFHGLVLRSNQERLRLKRIELKRISVKEYLARVRQDIRDEVAANFRASVNNALGDAMSDD